MEEEAINGCEGSIKGKQGWRPQIADMNTFECLRRIVKVDDDKIHRIKCWKLTKENRTEEFQMLVQQKLQKA